MGHCEKIRRNIIEMAYKCERPSHVGSALSVVDILSALMGEVCTEQDELILSKGHAAMAWYAALAEFDILPHERLDTFEKNDSPLSVLAVRNRELRILCSTGSLGQGISIAVGMAIAKQRRKMGGRVYVIIGNGEANEGIVWESALLAKQCSLDNLYVIVDHNRFQSDGDSSQIIQMDHMYDLWRANGFETAQVNGHDSEQIAKVIQTCSLKGIPKAIICKTTKGYGVSFMENSKQWHHNRLTKEKYEAAVKELERTMV